MMGLISAAGSGGRTVVPLLLANVHDVGGPRTRYRPIMLIFHLLCYAAVLKNLTYYAQNYARE